MPEKELIISWMFLYILLLCYEKTKVSFFFCVYDVEVDTFWTWLELLGKKRSKHIKLFHGNRMSKRGENYYVMPGSLYAASINQICWFDWFCWLRARSQACGTPLSLSLSLLCCMYELIFLLRFLFDSAYTCIWVIL